MNTAYIVKGRIIGNKRIELSESVPISDDEVTVIIEPGQRPARQRRKAGLLKGKIQMLPGFDEPLVDFREYME